MRERTMFLITAVFVAIYVSAFAILYVTTRDQEELFMLCLYGLSTMVMITTMILAVIFIRPSSQEKYERMMEKKKE